MGDDRPRADRRRRRRARSTSTPQSDVFEEWDLGGLETQLNTLWPVSVDLADLDPQTSSRETVIELLTEDALAAYDEREEEFGDELMRALERHILLQIIDTRWKEHLHEMDYLREGIHLRGFAQIDPLVAYKNEGFIMFEALMDSIWEEFARLIFHVDVELQPAQVEEAFAPRGRARRRQPLRRHRGRAALRARRGPRRRRHRRRRGRHRRPRPRARHRQRRGPASTTPPPWSRPKRRRSAATTPAGAAAARSTRSATAPSGRFALALLALTPASSGGARLRDTRDDLRARLRLQPHGHLPRRRDDPGARVPEALGDDRRERRLRRSRSPTTATSPPTSSRPRATTRSTCRRSTRAARTSRTPTSRLRPTSSTTGLAAILGVPFGPDGRPEQCAIVTTASARNVRGVPTRPSTSGPRTGSRGDRRDAARDPRPDLLQRVRDPGSERDIDVGGRRDRLDGGARRHLPDLRAPPDDPLRQLPRHLRGRQGRQRQPAVGHLRAGAGRGAARRERRRIVGDEDAGEGSARPASSSSSTAPRRIKVRAGLRKGGRRIGGRRTRSVRASRA